MSATTEFIQGSDSLPECEITLNVAETQRFCMHDGPGVRTTVFLTGCPLRCRWCHNPEMQKSGPSLLYYRNKCVLCGECVKKCPQEVHSIRGLEHLLDREKCVACGVCTNACPAGALSIIGRPTKIGEIVDTVLRDRAFYGEGGGVTISGGEPTMQIDGVLALLRACRDVGIKTAIETCGYFDPAFLPDLVPLVDTFLWDIKDTDPERHLKNTGVSPEPIIANLCRANELGAVVRLRCILIAGINDGDVHWERVASLRRSLRNCTGIDVLPYHSYGAAKAEFAGLFMEPHDEWIPSDDAVAKAKRIAES